MSWLAAFLKKKGSSTTSTTTTSASSSSSIPTAKSKCLSYEEFAARQKLVDDSIRAKQMADIHGVGNYLHPVRNKAPALNKSFLKNLVSGTTASNRYKTEKEYEEWVISERKRKKEKQQEEKSIRKQQQHHHHHHRRATSSDDDSNDKNSNDHNHHGIKRNRNQNDDDNDDDNDIVEGDDDYGPKYDIAPEDIEQVKHRKKLRDAFFGNDYSTEILQKENPIVQMPLHQDDVQPDAKNFEKKKIKLKQKADKAKLSFDFTDE